ncbi:MFS transporter [Streptomyces sp. NRRL S-1868]|uniref:MFS transporter n=1 Tax=Streptomyces sp. NRRL S-1868 TaxID=1463892 RepID=UPI00099DC09C|nr:MFS transporter [Streptomyces sp. NRRL S-1868]
MTSEQTANMPRKPAQEPDPGAAPPPDGPDGRDARAARLTARIDRLPMTWVQGRILTQGGLSTTLDGLDLGIMSFLLPLITTAFALSGSEQGMIASATLAGALVGDLSLALLGNRVGRKPLLLWSLVLYSGCTLLSAAAPDYGLLLVLRFLAGVGVGVNVNIVIPYLAEFAPRAKRAAYVGSLAGFFGLGYVLAALVGTFVVARFDHGWRWELVVVGLPVILALWWRRRLPESPRYLLLKGRDDEAEAVVTVLEDAVRARTGAPLPAPEPPEAAGRDEDLGAAAQFAGLWRGPCLRQTVVVWSMFFVASFAYYGFLTFLPSMLLDRGMSITDSFGYALMVEIAQVLGYYPAARLADRTDRKWSIVSCLAASTLCAYLVSQAQTDLSVLVLSLLLGFFLNGLYAPLYTYLPEVYPTQLRSMAAATSDAFSRIGGIVAPLLIGTMYTSLRFTGVFSLICLVLAAGCVLTLTLSTRTKGRSLETLTRGS